MNFNPLRPWILLQDDSWKNFHEDWWGQPRSDGQFSVEQPVVRNALGIYETLVFPDELYRRVSAATGYALAGIVIEPNAGIDGSTLRAFFLHRLTQKLPSYFTTSAMDTYAVDSGGVWHLPTASTRVWRPIARPEGRLWSFFDMLPDFGPDAREARRYPPEFCDARTIFSLILANPNQYRSWVNNTPSTRWSTPDDTLMYLNYDYVGACAKLGIDITKLVQGDA